MFGTGDDHDDNGGGFTEEVPLPPGLRKSTGGNAPVEDDDDSDDDGGDDDAADNGKATAAASQAEMPKKGKKSSSSSVIRGPPKKERSIKTAPLILLIIMTGTTLLPALIYAGDYMSTFLAKSNVLGSMGYRMGIGNVPRKRVMSFYEKHAPEKVPEVPQILSKYYGDYPKLIKSLERKYQDYGYFMGWEQDEAPMKLISEYLQDIYKMWIKQWNKFAPQVAKTAARNARYNLTFVYKKVSKAWTKHVWPHLEPIFGVPDGAEKQKRQDAADARKRKATGGTAGGSTTRRRNRDYRDDAEE